MSTLSRTKYWATIADEVYKLLVCLSLILGGAWGVLHGLTTGARLFSVGLTIVGIMGTIKIIQLYAACIREHRKGNRGLVDLIYQTGLERRQAQQIYKDPKRAEGKHKTLSAWFLPSFFLVMSGLLIISLIGVTLFAHLGRVSIRDAAIIALVPVAVFAWSLSVIFKARRRSKEQKLSLTDALYEWHYQLEVAKHIRVAEPKMRTSFMIGGSQIAIGTLAIKFDLVTGIMRYTPESHPPGTVAIFDFLPWVLIILGVLPFIQAFRYSQEKR